MRVLVVEDNRDMARTLRDCLTEEGYAVDLSLDGEDGLWRATSVEYDVAVLDIMLPGVTGLEILRRMRREGKRTPVLLLTARDGTGDRVAGLDGGADDYLVKPFALEELLARLRALLRRDPAGSDGLLQHGDIELDPSRRTVRRAGKAVRLTAKEFQILHVLMRDPDRVFSRSEIIDHVYDDEYEGMSNVVDVLMGRLRRKLAAGGGTEIPRTVRGVGYALAGGEHAQP
ncbi:MAG: response regulator transcription factor [Planctomycetaceae bacterium]|nr:response regulator transcription factor [Planctomycetaceae bacterium]